MRGEELLEKMELVDPKYLSEAEEVRRKTPWVKWGALAACLGLLVIVGAALPKALPHDLPLPGETVVDFSTAPSQPAGSTPVQTAPAGPAAPSWNPVYNPSGELLTQDLAYREGTFFEPLTAEAVDSVLPKVREEWMAFTGSAGFTPEGEAFLTSLYTQARDGSELTVTMSTGPIPRCCLLDTDPAESLCNGVIITLSRYQGEKVLYLEGEAKIGEIYFLFTAGALTEAGQADFEALVARFTTCEPDLTAIRPQMIPVDRKLTWEEAQAEADFGAYLPEEIPAGFTAEELRRYQSLQYDFLRCLFTQGMAELRWEVRYFQPEDAKRLTRVSQRENYDLALYPIPRAETVPEALWEIVNDPIFDIGELTREAVWARAYQVQDAGDVDGWRINAFCVRFGDVLVKVSGKGVDPDWVYAQLAALR